MKRLGFDLDGVFVNFVPAFQRLMVEMTGRNTFQVGDDVDPPSWNWPLDRGYTKAEMMAAFDKIAGEADWWFKLDSHADRLGQLAAAWEMLRLQHETYFITNRRGLLAKRQTEHWMDYFGIPGATVLIAGYRKKGEIAAGLELDAYLDDNYDNCVDVLKQAPACHTYLLHRNYNTTYPPGVDKAHRDLIEFRRVYTINDMLVREGLV